MVANRWVCQTTVARVRIYHHAVGDDVLVGELYTFAKACRATVEEIREDVINEVEQGLELF